MPACLSVCIRMECSKATRHLCRRAGTGWHGMANDRGGVHSLCQQDSPWIGWVRVPHLRQLVWALPPVPIRPCEQEGTQGGLGAIAVKPKRVVATHHCTTLQAAAVVQRRQNTQGMHRHSTEMVGGTWWNYKAHMRRQHTAHQCGGQLPAGVMMAYAGNLLWKPLVARLTTSQITQIVRAVSCQLSASPLPVCVPPPVWRHTRPHVHGRRQQTSRPQWLSRHTATPQSPAACLQVQSATAARITRCSKHGAWYHHPSMKRTN
jgi:hypothetical protein